MAARQNKQVKGEAPRQLSAADRLIIDSYKTTMEGLAAYYGEAFEFVLHDLSDYDHSIIKIINGFHSGRKAGAPITDFALAMLEQAQENGGSAQPFVSYTSKNKYGKPVQSTTIFIFGKKKKPIGLLCINLYLDSPLTSFFQVFAHNDRSGFVSENFSNDSDELIARSLEKVKSYVEADEIIPQSRKNKEIITILYHQGIFKLKNAVQAVSAGLGISRNTVYLHVRSLEKA